jgi:hypothetical protein
LLVSVSYSQRICIGFWPASVGVNGRQDFVQPQAMLHGQNVLLANKSPGVPTIVTPKMVSLPGTVTDPSAVSLSVIARPGHRCWRVTPKHDAFFLASCSFSPTRATSGR